MVAGAVDDGEAQHRAGQLRLAEHRAFDEDLLVVVEAPPAAAIREEPLAQGRVLGQRQRLGRAQLAAMQPPVGPVHVHAAERYDATGLATERAHQRRCFALGVGARIEDDIGRESVQVTDGVFDPLAVAVDVANVRRQVGLMLAAVEHRHVVAELDQPLHGQRADEPRASDYWGAHGAWIVAGQCVCRRSG
jgi:hypothetical protein